MKNHSPKGSLSRAWMACVLCLLMLLPLCISANAETANFTTLFELDPNEITSATGGSTEDFEVTKSNDKVTLDTVNLDGYNGKAIKVTSGEYSVTDKNLVMLDYNAVAISADVCFTSFPKAKSGASDSPVPTAEKFKSQSILAWVANTQYDGIRIDSEGNLYYSSGISTALDYKIELNKWYNLKVIYVSSIKKMEIYVNNERIGVEGTSDRRTATSSRFRIFDASSTYDCKIKNVGISATKDEYITGLTKEASADFISYQTTKPDKNGKFDVRIITGLDGLGYKDFGYKVIALTKNANGETVAVQSEGTDTKAYTSIYGGDQTYSVKDSFGYEYACLGTVTGLDSKSAYTELVIFPYTSSNSGDRVYGTCLSLVYTGETKDGYPTLTLVNGKKTAITATDDTYVYKFNATTDYGSEKTMVIRNPGTDALTYYRAVYLKFTLSPEEVAALKEQVKVDLSLVISSINSNRTKYPLQLYAVGTNWTENTLNYNNRNSLAPLGKLVAVAQPEEQKEGFYLNFDIKEYLMKQPTAADGSLTVAFCIKQEDGHTATSNDPGSPAAAEITFHTKEATKADQYAPVIRMENSLYGHATTTVKSLNEGYEPLSYAEYLVDMWFDDLVDVVYPKDEIGNVIYHDIETLAPNGYAATEATGDYTEGIMWKNGRPWSETLNTTKGDSLNGYYLASLGGLSKAKFARTLSTLGTSVSNEYLTSDYKTTSEYDVYGGITNAGFKGEATGFFHTEKYGSRTYIIDPLGNPYFMMGMNTVCLGDSANHKTYSLAKYETEENYYSSITASLKGMGINSFCGGDSSQFLQVEDGLSSVVSLSSMNVYMGKIGRGQIHEGVYPHNNTINVFDPDYPRAVNEAIPQRITNNNYQNNSRILGYTTDNELPSGNDILFRYLTLDPSVPDSIFSYHTAWTWFARRTGEINPTVEMLLASDEAAQLNSEFLSFLYSNYFRISREAIELVDKNHMYLGSRANGTCYDDEGFHRAAGAFLDVITVNLYSGLNPASTRITNFYRNAGIPFIVTEFFAKGLDAIDANGYKLATSTGAGIMVYTQEDRATYYQHYVLTLLESKACVGWVWYRYRDNDQGLWSVGEYVTDPETGKEEWQPTIGNLRMLHVTYGQVNPQANTFMDDSGKVWEVGDLPGEWKDDFNQDYKGESIASNQNVNKGIYNSDFTSVVTVYSYNADGTLDVLSDPYSFGSYSYKVQDPASENVKDGDVLTSLDGTKTFTIGTVTNADGSYTKTVLTAHEGKYIALANSFKEISDNLIGIINYLDANANE
jgi:hypothetical protein